MNNKTARKVRDNVDAKYRRGCQVAETAAPLSTGTDWFSLESWGRVVGNVREQNRRRRSSGPRGQGRVIDRG